MVKCQECGFLAVQDEYNDLTCEATNLVRKKGQHQSSEGNSTKAKVFCYLNSTAFQTPDLQHEHSRDRTTVLAAESPIVRAISVEVNCGEFTNWRPGKSPREHEELQNELVRSQAENDRRQEDLIWRQKVENAIERRHTEAAIAARQNRIMGYVIQFLLQ